MLEDISIITGGVFVNTQLGDKLQEMKLTNLGSCEKIIIDKGTTTIVNGGGDSVKIKSRILHIKSLIESSKSEYDKEQLQERLAKLSGGVAVITIGATTELEMKEKKDRVDDALHATRAAVEEGIVIGGGLALMQTKVWLEDLEGENRDQKMGIEIIESAIQSPFQKIIKNCGISPDVVLNNIINNKTLDGYNARTGEYVLMVKEGIIDPTKVTRLALEHASSVASLLLTTEVVIVKEKETDFAAKMNLP